MNKFEWMTNNYLNEETFVSKQDGVSLFDGTLKSGFNNGCIELTTHRLIWYDPKDINYRLGAKLQKIKTAGIVKGGIGKPNFIRINLHNSSNYENELDHGQSFQAPVSNSSYDFIQLHFKKSGENMFLANLNEILNVKSWITKKNDGSRGIIGIERSMENKCRNADKNIEVAFSDLNKLMNQALLMVDLCKKISQKISQNEEYSADETIQFKSYLLSMGIADPVTRHNFSNSQTYFEKLAFQLNDFLKDILPKTGGLMSSTDVFCRINRARGMELLSPEDLIESGKLMEKYKLPVILKMYESGLMVFQMASLNDEKSIEETVQIVKSNQPVTADKLSRMIHIPPVLSKERLLLCESHGKLCRDETVEGLKFFVNRFKE